MRYPLEVSFPLNRLRSQFTHSYWHSENVRNEKLEISDWTAHETSEDQDSDEDDDEDDESTEDSDE